MNFPSHKASMTLTHNAHKDSYQTVKEWWSDRVACGATFDNWVSEDQFYRALGTDEVWELQWHPETPVGTCVLMACDLDMLLLTPQRREAVLKLLYEVDAELESGRHRSALDLAMTLVRTRLRALDFDFVDQLLHRADPNARPIAVALTLLTATLAHADKLALRAGYFEQVHEMLVAQGKLVPGMLDGLEGQVEAKP